MSKEKEMNQTVTLNDVPLNEISTTLILGVIERLGMNANLEVTFK